MVFRRAGRPTWYVDITTPGGSVRKSTGTTDRATARAMGRLVEELAQRRAWDLLNAVLDGRLTLAALFDRRHDLEGARAQLRDVDLEPHIAGWTTWLADRVKPDTAAHYVTQLRTLIPEGRPFPSSRFTPSAVASWIATRTALPQKRRKSTIAPTRRTADAPGRAVAGATKRKYLAAARSFGAYLAGLGMVPPNIMRDVQAPPPGKPRVVELALADVLRIVDGAPAPYRALFALLYGAGLEVSAALRCVEKTST